MRRSASFRIFALVLMLARLGVGELMALPAAPAADSHTARPVMVMMAGESCAGMAGTPLAHTEQPRPVNNGTCCKSSGCRCLHAPALMVAQQMPMQFGLTYADVSASRVHRLSGPPPVFFRPPIQILH